MKMMGVVAKHSDSGATLTPSRLGAVKENCASATNHKMVQALPTGEVGQALTHSNTTAFQHGP